MSKEEEEEEEEGKEYVKVAEINEIMPSHMKEVDIDGKKILIANVNGEYYAIGSICTHEGGPLADGTLQDYQVECPWHGSKFDIRTGQVTNPPADEPEPSYKLKVDGNQILIKRKKDIKKTPESELIFFEKKVEGTDVMSFKFNKEYRNEDGNGGRDSSILSSLDYKAGQFAFFDIGGVYNDQKGPIRHFTISSSPTENFIMLSTRIRDSPYKKRLASIEKGTKVKVRGPEGQFVLPDEAADHSKTIIFLSGGIGVTPFRSMIKYATDKQLSIKIIMFDSNKNKDSILFKNEFDDWVNTNKNLNIIYTITEEENPNEQSSSLTSTNVWKGEYGRINKEMILKYIDDSILKDSIFYICGPPGMLKAMKSVIQEELEIPKERIITEEFTGY
ncbi:MAG: Rieske 2Fe-2S domain-containing protein [Candidatus Nitrosocosmicus sp.]